MSRARQRKYLPHDVDFDSILIKLKSPYHTEIFFDYTIDSITKLTKFSWTINSQRFTINPEHGILAYEIPVGDIKFYGRIKFIRMMSSEYPHESSRDSFIRDSGGRKVWLFEDVPGIWFNDEFWDEKEINIE